MNSSDQQLATARNLIQRLIHDDERECKCNGCQCLYICEEGRKFLGEPAPSSLIPIAGYERKYSVHCDGKVWNHDKQTWKNLSLLKDGYVHVTLHLNGRKEFSVHRLVALHFLPNPYGHPLVNHRDGNKSNNHWQNLEWTDSSGNTQHALQMGLMRGYLSNEEKKTLFTRVVNGEVVSDLAREIGRGPEVLSKMLRQYAEKNGHTDWWTKEMKRRRRDVAIRNLASNNS